MVVVDNKVEYGGFTLAVEDVELAACIDEKINCLTDVGIHQLCPDVKC